MIPTSLLLPNCIIAWILNFAALPAGHVYTVVVATVVTDALPSTPKLSAMLLSYTVFHAASSYIMRRAVDVVFCNAVISSFAVWNCCRKSDFATATLSGNLVGSMLLAIWQSPDSAALIQQRDSDEAHRPTCCTIESQLECGELRGHQCQAT